MKPITFFVLLIFIISCKESNDKINGNQSEKETLTVMKRYDYKSGEINYKTIMSGNVMGSEISGEGTESLVFSDWGTKEIKEVENTQTTSVNLMGYQSNETENTHTKDILDKDVYYQIDYKNEKIYKVDLKGINTKDNPVWKTHTTDYLEQMGAKMLGKETILGYDCSVWELMDSKLWIHRGIVLKQSALLMGVSVINEATSVAFNTVVDTDYQLPDFSVEELADINGVNDDVTKQFLNDNQEMVNGEMSFEEWKEMMLENDQEGYLEQLDENQLRKIYEQHKEI